MSEQSLLIDDYRFFPHNQLLIVIVSEDSNIFMFCQQKIRLDVSIGFHCALQMTNMQICILIICGSTSMRPLPDDILKQYEAVLKKRAVAISLHADIKSGSGITLIPAVNILCRIPGLK